MEARNEWQEVRFRTAELDGGRLYLDTTEDGPDSNKVLNSRASIYLILKDGITFAETDALRDHINRFVQMIGVQIRPGHCGF